MAARKGSGTDRPAPAETAESTLDLLPVEVPGMDEVTHRELDEIHKRLRLDLYSEKTAPGERFAALEWVGRRRAGREVPFAVIYERSGMSTWAKVREAADAAADGETDGEDEPEDPTRTPRG
ncbi:hypothetical protein [Phytomonospora endophytica]|uniref:Uncharacterized protein n=1 Tax=Phytomonospora endophytica TaxID=714109 RepID=A0A841FY98_9ACTN|nr:hypothetical protein [Phytomonospora endophytica]MBB6038327.1 hypothetical protein [Phytomonospora endophytica]GIG64257.1 hypothetical protein Pen01_05520 [Phytomonospora endophytica]